MPERVARVELTAARIERRRVLRWLTVPALLMPASALALPEASSGPRVSSARLWPAQEYTRVIIEGPVPIVHELSMLKDPDRVALDLAGVQIGSELAQLPMRVQPGDPYIAAIRFGRRAPDIVRVVIELKQPASAQLFALPPIATFAHRIVLDLYPLNPVDPLMALIQESERKSAPRVPSNVEPPSRVTPDRNRRPIIVAIDPGHGGEDPGAIGRRGTCEKDVVLSIARKLKRLIDADASMRCVLTRNDDYFVPLATRVQKARRVSADLFVSIHADAFSEPAARGSSVFALSEHGATSAAARWLANRENGADLIGGVNLGVRDPLLARTLLDLSQTAQIKDSLRVGRQVLDGIGMVNPLHKPFVEQAGFAVLKAPDIPSILVETAFISNPEEEQKLRSDQHQTRFAESIHDGIRRYFANNPPLARARTATG